MRTRIHCMTNPVTMQDVANVILAAGGSAIMAQDQEEVEKIVSVCQALLLNTGVPTRDKLEAWILAGRKANELGIPVILDPVGAGASGFRRELLRKLFMHVKVDLIRCNQEEAMVLLHLEQEQVSTAGVDSSVELEMEKHIDCALQLAHKYHCSCLVTGQKDVAAWDENSDGSYFIIDGGDPMITRITGGGCMLSALCAFKCGQGMTAKKAVVEAGRFWRACAAWAGNLTRQSEEGIGSFHCYLFDAVERMGLEDENQW